MSTSSNTIDAWSESVDVLELALELSSQTNRTSLTHHFAAILSRLYKPCRVLIYGADNGRKIESNRQQSIGNTLLRNFLQSVSTAKVLRVDDLDGAIECLDQKISQQIEVDSGTTRLLYPIFGRGGICNLLIVELAKSFPDTNIDLLKFVKLFENLLNIFDQAECDSLTGLMNRKAFDKSMDMFLVKSLTSRKTEKKITKQKYFAMLDIDHFKSVNDTYGHLYGDEVLLNFGRLLTESFRRHDWLFRFGGEEFCIVLEELEFDQAFHVIDRFRKKVESFDFPIVGEVTVSIGITGIDVGEALPIIIDKADKALYYAKRNGRNNVVLYKDIENQDGIVGTSKETSDITIF